jgi:hypothetical protein
MLAKHVASQPSAILYFTALVLGSYALSLFGAYALLEYSRRETTSGSPLIKPASLAAAVVRCVWCVCVCVRERERERERGLLSLWVSCHA